MCVGGNRLKPLEVSRRDQIWVGDITYVRLKGHFIYVALLMDVFTRMIRAWHLSQQLTQSLTLKPLEDALSTIERTRKTFALEGLEAALTAKKPSETSRPQRFDGEKEAHLIALACSQAPEGHARWTLRLLAEKMIELKHFSSISHESIRRILKKTNLDLG